MQSRQIKEKHGRRAECSVREEQAEESEDHAAMERDALLTLVEKWLSTDKEAYTLSISFAGR